MIVSLSELQFLVRRACLGAGYPYGLADDAAGAVRWLCARGLPGLESLERLISWQASAPAAGSPPAVSNRTWCWAGTEEAPLSPLLLGPAMAELPLAAGDDRPSAIAIGKLLSPLLMLPWAARLARESGAAIGFRIAAAGADISWLFAPDGSARGPRDVREPSGLAQIEAMIGDVVDIFGHRLDSGAVVAEGVKVRDTVWASLGAFAQRSYVPASDESRLRGAGAGLTDND